MALANGWSSKAQLTIDSTLVSANVTNLPVLLISDNFPTELLGATGGCKDDGGDIRFTDDIDGTTEYARDIVSVDKVLGTIAVYVKIPSISSSTDTTFYVWWNNPNASEPSETSDSGSKTCWSDYYGVYHFKDMINDWKGVQDSAGKWTNLTPIGTVATSDGHAEGLVAYDMSPTFGMSIPEPIYFNGLTKDFAFWVNFKGNPLVLGNWSTGTNGIPFGWLAPGQFGAGWGNFATQTGYITDTGWYHILIRVVAGTATCYINMVDRTNSSGTAQSQNFQYLGLADTQSPSHSLSELRMTRNYNNSVDYYSVMYVNESNPSAFVTAGTPIVVTASITITITVVDEDTNPIETALVYVDEDFLDPQIMNTPTNASGVASTTYDGASVGATLRVRKYGYKPFKTPVTLATTDITQTVTMITDPQQV